MMLMLVMVFACGTGAMAQELKPVEKLNAAILWKDNNGIYLSGIQLAAQEEQKD